MTCITTAPVSRRRAVLFTKDDNSVSVACTYDYMGRRATKVVTEHGQITSSHRFLIRMQKANKWGEWGKNRSELMIHLAPKTGIYGVRQTGSHGCISTKNEEGWKLFVDAMSKCGKETTKIELNIFNNTSIDINAE